MIGNEYCSGLSTNHLSNMDSYQSKRKVLVGTSMEQQEFFFSDLFQNAAYKLKRVSLIQIPGAPFTNRY